MMTGVRIILSHNKYFKPWILQFRINSYLMIFMIDLDYTSIQNDTIYGGFIDNQIYCSGNTCNF